MAIEITSKEEAIEKIKWLRKKLNEWGDKEGYRKTSSSERIEFKKNLIMVENFFGISRSKKLESRGFVTNS